MERLDINKEIEDSIKFLEFKKEQMARRVKELEWELEIYKNLVECYNEDLKKWYDYKIQRGWPK